VKLRKRYLPVAAALGAAVAVVPAIASSGSSPTVSGLSSIMWSPMEVAVVPGGTVMFQNTSGIPHGIIWENSDPATPTCESGVPVGAGHYSGNWSGSCTFTTEGVYRYYCSYHGREMSGEVIVNAAGTTTTTTVTMPTTTPTMTTTTPTTTTPTTTTPTTTTPTTTTPTTSTPTTSTPTTTTPTAITSTQPSGGGTSTSAAVPQVTTPGSMEMPSPSRGGHPLATLALASTQHGGTVHGTVQIAGADGGARLEIELLARSASLAKVRRSSSTRVGRLVRSSAPAGKVSFTVSLNAAAKRALRRRHKLALTVKIVLTPMQGTAVTFTRSLLLQA
jgi:plastocyanin